MWLNILQLMLVAYMPVPTALIAIYGPSSRIAPIGYALTGSGDRLAAPGGLVVRPTT